MWYKIETRLGNQRVAFEADEWDMECLGDEDLRKGLLIGRWTGNGWFAASEPGMEGPMEDVLKTANLLPVFSERLKSSLKSAGVNGIQYLPVKVLDSSQRFIAQYYLVNILNSLAALDHEKSKVISRVYKQRNGIEIKYIGYIERVCLKASVIEGMDIIRLSEFNLPIFVSARIKTIFEQGGFTGVGFSSVEVVQS